MQPNDKKLNEELAQLSFKEIILLANVFENYFGGEKGKFSGLGPVDQASNRALDFISQLEEPENLELYNKIKFAEKTTGFRRIYGRYIGLLAGENNERSVWFPDENYGWNSGTTTHRPW